MEQLFVGSAVEGNTLNVTLAMIALFTVCLAVIGSTLPMARTSTSVRRVMTGRFIPTVASAGKVLPSARTRQSIHQYYAARQSPSTNQTSWPYMTIGKFYPTVNLHYRVRDRRT
jgi:hypothetical protein